MTRSYRLIVAFVINMGAFLYNVALAIVRHHEHNFGLTVFHGAWATFNGIIALITLIFFFKASFEEDVERNRRKFRSTI